MRDYPSSLTCQDWLPRSRLNLYRRVRLRSPGTQLSRFLGTLLALPHLAAYVEELIVGRSTAAVASSRAVSAEEKYLPFTQQALLSRLRSLRRLEICCFHWQAHQPRYHALVAQYPVVELGLMGGYFRTMADLFRVVWSFNDLRVLRLIDVEPPEKVGPPLEGVISMRPRLCGPNWRRMPCAILVPPVGRFGTSLTKLKLTWARELGDRPTEALLAHVSALKSVRSITSGGSPAAGAAGRARTRHPLSATYVTRVLRRMPADGSLGKVALDFAAPKAKGFLSWTGFVQQLFTVDLRRALERFQAFQFREVIVSEPRRSRYHEARGSWTACVHGKWSYSGEDVLVQSTQRQPM
ncbi:hypothetical protein BV20DRAFT_1053136 [Pilatotrama ljubarskyi]|nr:hypothetical protein BV20DRAFT_1053136 [Pilatotrama ljubarskyi]